MLTKKWWRVGNHAYQIPLLTMQLVAFTTWTKVEFFFRHCQIKLSEKKELNVKEQKGRKSELKPCSA